MTLVAVAKLLKPRGVKGELWVDRYREGFPEFLPGSSLWLSADASEEARTVEGFFEYAKGSVLKLQGVDRPEAAGVLAGREVFLPEETVPEDGPDEFEPGGVVGWPVRDARRGTLGQVAEVVEGPAYWSFLLTGPGGNEIEVPAVKGYGVVIDKGRGEISVDLPEGFPGVDDAD
jgi:16S rRNA processing protein RimM